MMKTTNRGARRWTALSTIGMVVLGATAGEASRASAQLRGEIAVESRVFPRRGLYDGQDRFAGSLRANPRWDLTWANGRQLFSVELFGRIDQQDRERTHVDIRQLSWMLARESWEMRLGIRRVFWGVTESQHLVDVINQTDLVEDPDGEDKLGQPMVNIALIRSWGTLDLFLLAGFRERSFAGTHGRLRPGLPIETDLTSYESSAGHRHIDLAARWSRTFGPWDVGLSHFHGTSREPRLLPVQQDDRIALAPRYDQMDQTGLDVQLTTGAWLGKLEAIVRSDAERRFAALTTGFEYTFGTVFGTAADVGVLAEYMWDERGRDATTPFEDDLFVGTRIALNDVQSTTLLAGAILDRGGDGAMMSVEASRRLGASWSVALRLLSFVGTRDGAPLYGLRRDDFIELGIVRHF